MSKFEAPFIFKIRFYKPEGKNPSKNAAHINYIGTRPGVAIDETIEVINERTEDSENLSLKNNEQDWFNQDHEHFSINHGEDFNEPGTAAGHIKYADERPGSHGLFDQEGSTPNLLEIQNELVEHDGLVWRAILSLKENDAIKLGFTEKDRWEETLRATVAEAASHMKIKESNLRWVAAYHAEVGHPHVHLVMWEKEAKRDRGMLSEGEKNDVKRTFMREIYAEERTRIQQEKTVNRDLMRDIAKGDLQNYVQILREGKVRDLDTALEQQAIGNVEIGIAPKMHRADKKEIVLGLQKIAELMPSTGRIAFQYMDDDVKELTLQVADRILSQAFNGSMSGYMKAVEDQTLLHTNDPEKIEQAKQNAYQDIQKRIANVIVGAAAEVNRTSYLVINEAAIVQAYPAFLTANGKPVQDLNEDIVKAVTEHLRLFDFKKEEIEQVFEQWIPKIHTDKSIDEVKNIVSVAFENELITKPFVETKSINESDLTTLARIIGKELENPYDIVHYNESTLRSQLEMTELMKTTIIPVEYETEIESIAVLLNSAMKETGITFKNRELLMNEWSELNEVNIDYKDIHSATRKDYKLTQDDWEELCRHLTIDVKSVSWNVKTETILNHEKIGLYYNDLISVSKITKGSGAEYKQLIEKIVPLVAKNASSLIKEIDHWNTLLPSEYRFSESETSELIIHWKRNDVKNVRIALSLLNSAGYSREEAMNKMTKFIPNDEISQKLSQYVRMVDIKMNQELSISTGELKSMGDLTGFNIFKSPSRFEVDGRVSIDTIDLLKNSILEDKSNQVVQATVFWMDQTLRQSGLENPERIVFINNWAAKNEITELDGYKKVDLITEKSYKVKSEDWEELCDKLNIGNIRTPWDEKSTVFLDKEKMNIVLEIAVSGHQDIEETKDAIEVRDFILKTISHSSSTPEELTERLNTYMKNIPEKNRLTTSEMNEKIQSWKEPSIELFKSSKGEVNVGYAFNRNELKEIGKKLGIDEFDKPNEYKGNYITEPAIQNELADTFKNAKIAKPTEEIVKSVSFWMNQTMIQSGINPALRVEIMNHWAKHNGVEETKAFRSLVIAPMKELIVGNTKWKELCEVFELGDLKVPWHNDSIVSINKEKITSAIDLIITRYPNINALDETKQIAIRDFVIKGLANISSNQEGFSEKLKQYNNVIPHIVKLDTNQISEIVHGWKRNDFDYVHKVLKVENELEKTISDYAVVLKTLNISDMEVKNVVESWIKNTSISINPEKLNDLLDKTIYTYNEKQAWGQAPTVSKENFEKLCTNLNIKSPYLWKPSFTPTSNLLNRLWKNLFSAVEQEKQQGQAQAELQQRDIQKQQQQRMRLLKQNNNHREQ